MPIRPGSLAVIVESCRVCLVISGPVKKSLVGFVYQVMTDSSLTWVYPENIDSIESFYGKVSDM